MKKSTLGLMVCLLGIPACAFAEDPPQSAAETLSVQSEPATVVGPQGMDLVNGVRTDLKADPSLVPSLYNLQLRTTGGGVMQIKGTVPTKDAKKAIESKVRSYPGVTQVDSQIRVA